MEELGDHQERKEEKAGFFQKIFSGIFGGRNKPQIKEDQEILAQKMLKELVTYLVFICIVCIIAFGMSSTYTYYYTKVLMDLFINNKNHEVQFTDISSVEDFKTYTQKSFLNCLYWEEWYNGVELKELNGYIYYENRLLGLPRLRQVRVKPDTCDIVDDFKNFIDSCFGPYDRDKEDEAPFGEGLTDKKNTAWHYRSSEEINGFWHWGKITSYDGGGYVLDLSLDKDDAAKDIGALFENLWIRRGTRAVFLSFTVYNANVNLFCIIVLTVEFPATGGAFPSASFTTVKLYYYNSSFEKFLFACQIVFCIFIFYYMVEEIIEILFGGRAYFTEFWNFLDILLLGSSLVCIGFQVYREVVMKPLISELLEDFNMFQDYVSLAFVETQSRNSIAITVFLSWVKVLKYISFNKTMIQLATTLSRCAKDLMGFFIMFFIVFLAFTQLGYLLFGSQVEDFSTFMNSFFTLFRIILGDFNFYEMERANRILGPIFFMLFVFFVFFVLINMFLAIINDTYSEVKSDMTKKTDMFIMSNYLKQSYNRLLAKIQLRKESLRLESINKQYTTKEKLCAKDWLQALVEQGFEEELVEHVFNKIGLEKDHILDPKEQKKILMEIQRKKSMEKEDEENVDIDQDETTSEYVPAEEFCTVLRRVDRMETTLTSLVGNIDAVLRQLSSKKVSVSSKKSTISH